MQGATARVINLLGPDGGVPLSDGDFADPFVLDTGLIPYGFTTNSRTANVPVSRPGLRGEVELGDALPEVGSWTEKGLVWAPGVIDLGDDRFVLYYTSKDLESGLQCIGVATSDSAKGPYVDDRGEPFICQRELGGSIDASPVMVDGDPWLVWKGDGNCCGLPTTLWAQQLGADGTTLVGERHGMAVNDQKWEGPLVEGPSVVVHDGRVHLFYSANRWDTADYSIGHAVCESITGPCEKDPEPFLASGDEYSGPGGQEFFTDRAGQLWMAFHAWLPGEVGYDNGGQRRLFLERIEFDDSGAPQLAE